MASVAQARCVLLCYLPSVRVMAAYAFKCAQFHVPGVLPHLCFAAMAGTQAVLAGELDLFVGLVAAMAFKRGHYTVHLQFGVALKAFPGCLHCFGTVAESMAIQTVQTRCSHPMNQLVRVTGAAFVGQYLHIVHLSGMAGVAGDVMHENMACVAVGVSERYGALRGMRVMTVNA